MRDYKLGELVISVTPELYEKVYKAQGYEPVVNKVKSSKKEEVKREFKEPVIEETSYKKFKKEN